jgi:hypothetical protein
MEVRSQVANGFTDVAKRTLQYGYFAPLQAAWLTRTRKGGYFLHLKALYRLAFKRA